MGVKRSDCRTKKEKGKKRTETESWEDEASYQLTRIQEAATIIRNLARRRGPAWTLEQVTQITNVIEAEANEIRLAYQEPAKTETFQFATPLAEVQKAS